MGKTHPDHLESARILLSRLPSALLDMQREYRDCITKMAVSHEFWDQTWAFVGRLRSILDYLAQEVSYCSNRPPNRIYFPIAPASMLRATFEATLRRTGLPGIDVSRPDIYEYLVSLQHFYPGNDDRLAAFCRLSNTNKHHTLSPMQIAGCRAVLICVSGVPVM
jgi:hypothetical protein